MEINKLGTKKQYRYDQLEEGTYFTDEKQKDLWIKISYNCVYKLTKDSCLAVIKPEDFPLYKCDGKITWWLAQESMDE